LGHIVRTRYCLNINNISGINQQLLLAGYQFVAESRHEWVQQIYVSVRNIMTSTFYKISPWKRPWGGVLVCVCVCVSVCVCLQSGSSQVICIQSEVTRNQWGCFGVRIEGRQQTARGWHWQSLFRNHRTHCAPCTWP
jgi:hypothetical protein